MKAKGSKYPLLILLFLCAFYLRAQQPKASPTATVYNHTQANTEKTKPASTPARSACDVDSLKTALKTARQDTSTINLINSFCIANKYKCAPGQLLPYALLGLRLADSLVLAGSGAGLYNLKKKQGTSYNVVGAMYNSSGEYDSALIYFNKSLTIRERIGDRSGMINSYNSIGIVYRLKSDWVKAAGYNLKALKTAQELQDSIGIAKTYFHLSSVNVGMENYPKALSYGLSCLKINRKKSITGVAECLGLVSGLYAKMGDTLKSLACEFEAMRISDSLGMLQIYANSLNNIAVTYADMGKLDEALVFYKKAAGIYADLLDDYDATNTIMNICRIYYKKKDFKEARRLMLLNMETFKKYRTIDLWQHYTLLSFCDSALGNYKEAFMFLRLSQSSYGKQLSLEKTNAVSELETKYAVSQKEVENKLLAQQNQIQQLELKRNRYFIAALVGGTLLILLLGLLLVRQARLRAGEANRAMEQRLLRSQMNPHFIFNCLQAIQNYMLKSEVKDSIRYLNTFAVITREVLENSRTEYIPLAKDIKLLKSYLELQKLRFTDRFEYEFHLDQELEASHVLIPPMLFQPFIENAIEHGMSDMESGGKIDLYYKMTEGYLVMEIADNGKGLGNSTTDKKTHESLATTITKERIELMNKRSKRKLAFALEEAYPEAPARKGVKVIFRIPLNLSQQGKSILVFN
jgi:tetratricopeptide (TPR) repeat protein